MNLRWNLKTDGRRLYHSFCGTNIIFLSKIDIKGFRKVSEKNKIDSSGNWAYSWPSLVQKFDAYPVVPTRHVLNKRFLKLNFVSCTTSLFGFGSFPDSIEHDFIRIWKSETGKAWQISTVRLLNQWWSVVSSIPTEGHFMFCWSFLRHPNANFVQKCQICVFLRKPLFCLLLFHNYANKVFRLWIGPINFRRSTPPFENSSCYWGWLVSS